MVTYICVLDFEATCWDGSKEHEIIEFPSVLGHWNENNEFKLISEIQLFVKPSRNPVISEFCHNLTGITQEQIDGGISLEQALKTHYEWLSDHVENAEECVVIVTCGHWDLATMLPQDIAANGLSYPSPVYRRYANVKQVFSAVTGTKKSFSMTRMLNRLNLPLIGRHHSGIDDSKNIYRIVEKLIEIGMRKSEFTKFIIHVNK